MRPHWNLIYQNPIGRATIFGFYLMLYNVIYKREPEMDGMKPTLSAGARTLIVVLCGALVAAGLRLESPET